MLSRIILLKSSVAANGGSSGRKYARLRTAPRSPCLAVCRFLSSVAHDSTPYVDWEQAERVRFTKLKPSTTAISIRLPTDLLEQIKTSANRKDVPYQSLIKLWLAEKKASQAR